MKTTTDFLKFLAEKLDYAANKYKWQNRVLVLAAEKQRDDSEKQEHLAPWIPKGVLLSEDIEFNLNAARDACAEIHLARLKMRWIEVMNGRIEVFIHYQRRDGKNDYNLTLGDFAEYFDQGRESFMADTNEDRAARQKFCAECTMFLWGSDYGVASLVKQS